jgi:hypothetical protein
MALRGNLSSIAGLKQRLRELPTSVAHDVAQRAAPVLTGLARGAFDTRRTVYGEQRPAGVEGNDLTLEKTGATRHTIAFVANGTTIRCVLPTRYARFLIGKYGILPNGAMPVAWSEALRALVAEFTGSA